MGGLGVSFPTKASWYLSDHGDPGRAVWLLFQIFLGMEKVSTDLAPISPRRCLPRANAGVFCQSGLVVFEVHPYGIGSGMGTLYQMGVPPKPPFLTT